MAAKKYKTITAEHYDYILNCSLREPDLLKSLREEIEQQVQRADMMTAPEQTQLLVMLLKLMNAKRAIELGVFTGYTTLAIATTLPRDGEVIACDISEKWANLGKPFWKEAGVLEKITFKVGSALSTLQALIDENQAGTFDFIYIDADKVNYDEYYEQGLKLLRVGGLMVLDNMLWTSSLVPDRLDKGTQALDDLNKKLHHDERIDISFIPMCSGFVLARKRAN